MPSLPLDVLVLCEAVMQGPGGGVPLPGVVVVGGPRLPGYDGLDQEGFVSVDPQSLTVLTPLACHQKRPPTKTYIANTTQKTE